MPPYNRAIDPSTSASVSASAGTGKTWLLVSRIVRLLLSNVKPQSILAITFTRKAAAEMQDRLNQRLLQLATCDESSLLELLDSIGAPQDAPTREQARLLYEKLLLQPQTIKITTFHAFCQDLLKRFPFEADVPPGFELAEQTADLETEAWDALVNETTNNPNCETATALEILFDYCNGLPSTQKALKYFLDHRSDWWAYTYLQNDPVEFACQHLLESMELGNRDIEPAEEFFSQQRLDGIREFSDLLNLHSTKTNAAFANKLDNAISLAGQNRFLDAFQLVAAVFNTDENKPRARKSSKAQIAKMGQSGEDRFLELHEWFCRQIENTRDVLLKKNTFHISSAWYQAGNQLLNYYQWVKKENRVLDFADLEWNAFRLLHEENNAMWVQYKLDSRINHILVDEFQDTNPTQWQLLYPLLQELASSNQHGDRTVFLVGDTKQSIYRFRRAQPELFENAQLWLENNLGADNTVLDTSRRSAQAIMDFVNICFSQGELNNAIGQFHEHKTVFEQQWGYVELAPLFTNDQDSSDEDVTDGNDDSTDETISAGTPLRNPLVTPRPFEQDLRYKREAEFIASKITEIVQRPVIVEHDGQARPLRYDDIIILLRHRTHAHYYENALMKAGIPYVGTERGTLLEALEIRDVVCLLETLVTPYSNLSLATVLRSPMFDFSDDDLMTLAELKSGYWYQRLQLLAEQHTAEHIVRAKNYLELWRSLVETIPVHDLLDRIYCDINIVERYQSAYPPHLRHRVTSNLARFIELALEIDSGRYPSIGRFLFRIQSMRASDQDAPDETPAGSSTARVRLLTIHGAKGLEAPVIFLADSANTSVTRTAYHPLVHWPPDQNSPRHFLLSPKKSDMDTWTRQHLERYLREQSREETNLLYVALTRARQVLYITGCQPRNRQSESPDRQTSGWYGAIRAQLEHVENPQLKNLDNFFVLESGSKTEITQTTEPDNRDMEISTDQRLSRPVSLTITDLEIAPSQSTSRPHTRQSSTQTAEIDEDLQQRGVVIHKILQYIAQGKSREEVFGLLEAFNTNWSQLDNLEEYYDEAEQVVNHSEFQFLFDHRQFKKAYNEVPICFASEKITVTGIIDRLVIDENSAYVIDYKTHVDTSRENQRYLTQYYENQLSLYCIGARKILPGIPVKAALLFTHNKVLQEITIQNDINTILHSTA